MNSLNTVFRTNPELTIAVALVAGITIVLTLMFWIMRGVGASPRPIIFLAILIAPLALVFLAAALVNARSQDTQAVATFELPVMGGRFADRATLFGPDISEQQIRDAKAIFPEFFGEAEIAELAVAGTGETVVIAQFPNAAASQRAARIFWDFFQITDSSGNEHLGWRGKRQLNSDYIEMLRTGRHLFFWTALTEKAAAVRRAASTLPVQLLVFNQSAVSTPAFPGLQSLATLFQPTGMKVGGTLLLVALYVVWFFKGAAWASSSPALADVPLLSANELSRRLESINALDVPFHVERGGRPNEYIATWRYADAKWVDHARAHGLRRTFRIRLVLDEASHTVRATDYVARYDWSAGGDGARIEWQQNLGILFFQRDQQRVFGLQLDEQGRFTPTLSYSYGFDLDEMTGPLLAAATQAGWNWRPTLWQGPAWLRWLTE